MENSTAILDVISESKEISSLLKENKESNDSTENSALVRSQSFESLATLEDREHSTEVSDTNRNFYVKIDNPQKYLDTLETYITFRLSTRAREYPESEYIVRRRYNDFAWLRQKLVDTNPFCIVPPLPGKHSLIGQLDRYSKEFIYARMKLLNVFIMRIIQHPTLNHSEHLKIFLTSSQCDFNKHRKQFSCISVRNNSISQTMSSHVTLKNHQVEFNKTKEYLSTLSEKLSLIDKVTHRINKERKELVTELNNFHPIFNTWANTEPELGPLLRNIAGAIDKTASAYSNLMAHSPNIINPLRDFVLYINVVQETLSRREVFQTAYENSLEELVKKRNEKDHLLSNSQNPSTSSRTFSLFRQKSSEEQLEKLGSYIPQLVKKVEINQDNLECANESLKSDLERWQHEKQVYLKKMLLDFVNVQIEFYEKSVRAWEQVADEATASASTTIK